MRINLSRERMFLYGMLALLVAVTVLTAYLAPGQDVDSHPLSTYSTQSDGARATFLLFSALGAKAERWQQPPAELPEDTSGVLLIVSQPSYLPTAGDRAALTAFVHRGGTLLFVGTLAPLFLTKSNVAMDFPSSSWKPYPAMASDPLNSGIPAITMASHAHWVLGGNEVGLFGSARNAVAVTYESGKGRVIWLGSQVPLSNAGLKAKGNVDFLANVLAATGTRQVLWDEYFTDGPAGRASAFSSAPVVALGAQLLFIFALVIFTHGRRLGPLREYRAGSAPMAQLEFVRTLGSLYRSAHAANIALDIAYQRFVFLATRRLGLTATVPAERLAGALASAVNAPVEQIREVLEKCQLERHSQTLSAAEAAELMNTLHSYMVELKLVSETVEGKH